MTTIRLSPLNGAPPRALMVLLHGVGDDGASMLPLAQKLQRSLPDVAFTVPDATMPSDLGHVGFQWFSIRGVTDANRSARILAALPTVEDLVAEELTRSAVKHHQLVICGFSQGAMMALALADRPQCPAAIVSIAGRIARPIPPASGRSPTLLLTHGDADAVVPFACLTEAANAFASAGFATETLPVADLDHQISEQQARAIGAFSARALGLAAVEQAA